MSTLVQIGLANAAAAALLALLATVVGKFCRRPALAHGLWLLVLLKLVTPPIYPMRLPWLPAAPSPPAEELSRRIAAPPDRLSPPNDSRILPDSETPPSPRDNHLSVAGLLGPEVPDELKVALAGKVLVEPDPVSAAPALDADSLAPSARTTPARASAAPPAPLSWDFGAYLVWLGWVWLAGSGLWFAWAGLHIYRWRRLLRCAWPAPVEIQEQARRLAERLGLAHCPTVWLVPGPVPPMVWGGIGPTRLFFPVALLDRLKVEERGALLAHELAHVRRRDYWVRWLEVVVQGLYWWYPLVWHVRRQLSLREEECCDAWVVSELPARVYATAILETVDFLAEPRTTLPMMASGLSNTRALKQRITQIMNDGLPKRLSCTGWLIVLALAALLLPLVPTLARSGRPSAAETDAPSDTSSGKGEQAAPDVDEEALVFAPSPVPLVGLPLIHAAVYSPDGKTFALATDEKTIQLRDVATRQLKLTLTGHSDVVTCLAFAPDGKTLASGSPDQTVKLWDTATGKELLTFKGHASWVYAIAYSPEGKTLASAGYDKVIRLWDPATGQERAALKGHTSSIRAVAFSPDGKILASGSGDRTVKLWDLETLQERATLPGHQGPIRALAFSPDGKTLVSASEDNTVRLWDTATGKERVALRGHGNEVWSLAFSPKGLTLATGSLDAAVRLWDPATGQLRVTLRGHTAGVAAVAFAPDGKQMMTASHDRSVKLWLPAVPTAHVTASLHDPKGPVSFAAYSPDGKWVAAGGDDRSVRLWRMDSRFAAPPLQVRTGQLIGVAYSPDGKLIAIAGQTHVRLLDAATGQERAILREHALPVRSVAFTPDGKALVSGGGSWTRPQEAGEIKLWEVATGKELASFQGHKGLVYVVSVSPDGKILATGSWDQTVKLWDLDTRKERATLTNHKGGVRSLAFSPDSKTLVTGSHDRTVGLWNVATGQQSLVLTGHPVPVEAVAFAPDNQSVASASSDGTVKVWDLNTGNERASFKGFAGNVVALAFSPNGKILASGGGSWGTFGEINLWDLASGQMRAALHSLPGAYFEGLAFSPDGKTLAGSTGMRNGSGELRVWDLATLPKPVLLKGHEGSVSCAAFSPDGSLLATGSSDQTVKVWLVATGELRTTLQGHAGNIHAVAFHADGKTLVTVGEDKTVRRWDVARGKEQDKLPLNTMGVHCQALAPDGKTLATDGGERQDGQPRTIKIWDLSTGKERTLRLETDRDVLALAFTPDGKSLAAALGNDTVKVWDVAAGKEQAALAVPHVRVLTFAPNGRTLAVGQGPASDGTVTLWNTTTWKERAILQGHKGMISSVAFSPDGKTLASAGQNETVKLWQVPLPRSALAQTRNT